MLNVMEVFGRLFLIPWQSQKLPKQVKFDLPNLTVAIEFLDIVFLVTVSVLHLVNLDTGSF